MKTGLDKQTQLSRTSRAKNKVEDLLNLAALIKNDSYRKKRLEEHECKACFYFTKLGGAAITNHACVGCKENQIYPSTNVDILCLECAKKHKLCKHCGGDVEMRTRRKIWESL